MFQFELIGFSYALIPMLTREGSNGGKFYIVKDHGKIIASQFFSMEQQGTCGGKEE